jgi:hypothetical protein
LSKAKSSGFGETTTNGHRAAEPQSKEFNHGLLAGGPTLIDTDGDKAKSQTPKSKSQENPKLQNPRGRNFIAETQRGGRGTQRKRQIIDGKIIEELQI